MLRSGDLSTRITVQQLEVGKDAAGQPHQNWAELFSCWANVRHASGMESLTADADISATRASVRIRWRTGVTAAMRVVIGSAVYSIRAVLPDLQRREYVDLVCEAFK